MPNSECTAYYQMLVRGLRGDFFRDFFSVGAKSEKWLHEVYTNGSIDTLVSHILQLEKHELELEDENRRLRAKLVAGGLVECAQDV